MNTRSHAGLLFVIALLLAFPALRPVPALAAGQSSLTLAAAPDVILADGKSDTMITATVRDSSGNPAPDGTTVQFSTSLGTLSQDTASTQAGAARVRLTSITGDGVADVSATAFLGSAGGAPGFTRVEFTTDREIAFAGPDARWIQVDCPQYLVYSADVHVIEAQGKNGSAHFRYKALSLTADSFQLDLRTQILLADNAVLKRGKHTLTTARLRYDLDADTGTAVAEDARNVAQTVDISGPKLETTPQSRYEAQYSTENNIYKFVSLYTSHVVVAARSIAVDPGRTVQFRRATVYQDGRKAFSLAYQVMPIGSNQLFGQQLVGFNSSGLSLNVPYYYHVDPNSTGAVFLRNSVVGTGDGSGPLDSTGTRPGLAIDLKQTYALGLGGSGQLLVNGLTRSNWGAHWDHTQRLDDATRGYFLLDSPTHRSLFGSSNLSHEFGAFSLNVTASGSRDPGQNGYSSSSDSLNSSLQTDPKSLGRSGLNMVTSLGLQTGQYIQQTPQSGRQVTPVSTRTLDLRFFTAPLHPDGETTVTNGLTLGQSWGSGRSSPTLLLNLGANRRMADSSALSLNYTWRYDPLFSQLGADPTGGPFGTLFRSASDQRLTLNFSAQPNHRLSFNLAGGYGLPLGDSNLYTTLAYRLTPDWGVGLGSFFDRYLGDQYRETQFSVSRRFFGRDLTFTYSTLTKRIRFDFAGASF